MPRTGRCRRSVRRWSFAGQDCRLSPSLGGQGVLHRLEEIPKSIPGIRNVRQLEAGLLDQIAPNMDWGARLLDRSQVEAAFPRGIVVEAGAPQRGRAELRSVDFHDVAYVDQPVVPGVLRQNRRGSVMENEV